MGIPVQPVLLSIPTLVYVAFRMRQGVARREALGEVGWRTFPPVHLLWALGVLAVAVGLGWLATRFFPVELLRNRGTNLPAYAGWSPGPRLFLLAWLRETIYVAFGEEVFFRGLLGGWLVRRLGFAVGNTLQALLFLLPHLLLLLVSRSVWPLLVAQLVTGWLLGWLRHHSGSFLPGWLVHGLANAVGVTLAMR